MSAGIPGGEKQLLRGHIPLRFSRASSGIRSMFKPLCPLRYWLQENDCKENVYHNLWQNMWG